MTTRRSPALGAFATFLLAILVGGYFSFTAMQGDHGVFRRVEIEAEARALAQERDRLALDVARMENLTRRLSDNYLDLDLLDQQARDVLGMARADEVVIR